MKKTGSKAERTTKFILETVAPVFNKQGYAGTSMKNIADATGLTKGAIYGNFKNKDELALAAFNYNIRRVMGALKDKTDLEESPFAKLKAVTNFYREYYQFTITFGGCPLVNVGVDSIHLHPDLLKRVKEVVVKMERNLARMIENAIEAAEIQEGIDVQVYTRRLFAMFEGSIFMSTTMKDGRYILDMMDHIDAVLDSIKV